MTAVRMVVAIAGRVKQAKSAAVALLAKACPPLPPAGAPHTELAMCESHAENVHGVPKDLTGKSVAYPEKYDDAARTKLMASW